MGSKLGSKNKTKKKSVNKSVNKKINVINMGPRVQPFIIPSIPQHVQPPQIENSPALNMLMSSIMQRDQEY
jgi:hypothetical protein